jgi:hypothetical protein
MAIAPKFLGAKGRCPTTLLSGFSGHGSAYAESMSKTPKVVPITEDKARMIAQDETSRRFILGVGKHRIAFDFSTRVTHLPPQHR